MLLHAQDPTPEDWCKIADLPKNLMCVGIFYMKNNGDFLREAPSLAGKIRSLFARLQFVRFVFVGVFNTAFSYSIYAALLFIGLEYRIASLLALILGIIFSFITQGTIVFRNATPITFVKFVSAWMFIYVFNITLISLLMRAPMSAYVAGAIATIPVVLISYIILKYLVFGTKSPARSANRPSEP